MKFGIFNPAVGQYVVIEGDLDYAKNIRSQIFNSNAKDIISASIGKKSIDAEYNRIASAYLGVEVDYLYTVLSCMDDKELGSVFLGIKNNTQHLVKVNENGVAELYVANYNFNGRRYPCVAVNKDTLEPIEYYEYINNGSGVAKYSCLTNELLATTTFGQVPYEYQAIVFGKNVKAWSIKDLKLIIEYVKTPNLLDPNAQAYVDQIFNDYLQQMASAYVVSQIVTTQIGDSWASIDISNWDIVRSLN